MKMTLKQLTAKALRAKGLNGLTDCDGCACHVKDLMPCDEPKPTCEAVKLVTVKAGKCKDEHCEWSDDDHYHEHESKPSKKGGRK